jgi:hypothetical protein
VVRNCDVLFFRSKTVALNKLVGQPKLPGLIEDYRSTFAKAKAMKVDVLGGLHPEVYDVRAGEARANEGRGVEPVRQAWRVSNVCCGARTGFRQSACQADGRAPEG